jgi:hypothetical protein
MCGTVAAVRDRVAVLGALRLGSTVNQMEASMMVKRIVVSAALVVLATAGSASAQSSKVEVGVVFGGTLADGVSGDNVVAANGNVYNSLEQANSFSWGFNVGVLPNENLEVGFNYGNAGTTLQASGTTTTDIGDMSVNTYHGYVAYNFGGNASRVRPYVLGGFGATSFGSVNYTTPAGLSGQIDGLTKFSSTWGAGVKVFPAPHVGVRFGARWTPTYIKSDATGWWCDPYWGCYVTGDAQYANQFELSGGVAFRF